MVPHVVDRQEPGQVAKRMPPANLPLMRLEEDVRCGSIATESCHPHNVRSCPNRRHESRHRGLTFCASSRQSALQQNETFSITCSAPACNESLKDTDSAFTEHYPAARQFLLRPVDVRGQAPDVQEVSSECAEQRPCRDRKSIRACLRARLHPRCQGTKRQLPSRPTCRGAQGKPLIHEH